MFVLFLNKEMKEQQLNCKRDYLLQMMEVPLNFYSYRLTKKNLMSKKEAYGY